MEVDHPKQIGRYRVERLLGAGAMGFVFLASDPELDRLVAIKTLRDLTLDEAALEIFLERFRNEARAAARLHHPAIVQVYDVGNDPEAGPFLVFEYVPGSTLRKLIRTRGQLSPDDVVLLAEEIGEALDEAHSNNVIHRDIKPDNLLVTEFGKGKLADFGVARIPNAALTREGQFLGTPCYAAPETVRDGDYGPETDLFSFAAVLYEAASGKRAFPGDEAVAVAHKVVHEDPIPPSSAAPSLDIPAAVDEVILQGLSKDPARRQRSAGALALALREAYGEAGLLSDHSSGRLAAMASYRESPGPAGGASQRSQGWLLVAVVASLTAIGIAFVLDLAGPKQLNDPADASPEDAGLEAGIDGSTETLLGTDAAVNDAADDADGPSDAASVAQDADLDADVSDASADAAPDAPLDADGGVPEDAEPPPSHLPLRGSPEEIAKDAVERARALIRAGRFPLARRALEVARHHDPGLDEIEELEDQIPVGQ